MKLTRCRPLGITALMLGILSAAPEANAKAPNAEWPTLESQLAGDNVVPGSALENLIRENQDFQLLRPDEAHDKIGLPPWLRVAWRKAHPEITYAATDPTGGYPRVLLDVHSWMVRHQDLVASTPTADAAPILADSTSVGGNVRISGSSTSPHSESSISIDTSNPSRIIGASNDINTSHQAQFYSTDGGATWSQTTLPLTTGDAFESDPTVGWTSDGEAWAGTIGVNNFQTVLKLRWCKSTNGGATWTFDSTISGSQASVDKPMTWIDRSASSTFKDSMYATWHNGNPVYVNHRSGPGGTWGSPLRVSAGETTGTGIGGDVKTNSAGDVFVFWPDTGSSKIYTVKSTNGGGTYSSPTLVATTFDSFDIGIPAMNSRRALIYVTAGAYKSGSRNDAYAAWTDQTGAAGCNAPVDEPGGNTASPCTTRIWFARSTDGGATWSAPLMINNPPSLNDQFNPWLAVDETNGRISVMYYDTVNDPGRRKTDVWYQTSSNGGVTWSAPTRVTTAMTDKTVAGADSGNQYGDYNGMAGYNNSFFPSWTDRRNNAREEIWTAHITETNTPPAPGASDGLTVHKDNAGHLLLSWGPDCGGATTYGIYRGDLRLGYSSLAPESGFCSTASTSATLPQGPNPADFLLVTPNDGSHEGSYGTNSAGVRRPPATTECFPQGAINACAP